MRPTKLSLVIPTYNRKERLAMVLTALAAQTTPAKEFEVVVVDDGSSDGTGEWLSSFRPGYGLRVIRLTNGGPARARNAGIVDAQGELVLFIDDDVEPMRTLIEEHLKSHAKEDRVVVMGPLGSLPHYAQPWVAWEQAKVEQQYAAMARGDWAPTFRQFWTGNASVAREYLVALGGFNTEFNRGEDVELAVRMAKLGLGFRFNPAARALHHAERSLKSWENAHSSYGRLEVAIFRNLGEEALHQALSENWRRLNPATRLVVRSCLKRPVQHTAVCRLLRAHLELASRTGVPLGADRVCSVLANLLYWRASCDALGPTAAARVLEG